MPLDLEETFTLAYFIMLEEEVGQQRHLWNTFKA